MGLRDIYVYAIQTAKGKFHGNAEERDGKLLLQGHGRDRSREERNLDRHQDHPDVAVTTSSPTSRSPAARRLPGQPRPRRPRPTPSRRATRSAPLPRSTSATPAPT